MKGQHCTTQTDPSGLGDKNHVGANFKVLKRPSDWSTLSWGLTLDWVRAGFLSYDAAANATLMTYYTLTVPTALESSSFNSYRYDGTTNPIQGPGCGIVVPSPSS